MRSGKVPELREAVGFAWSRRVDDVLLESARAALAAAEKEEEERLLAERQAHEDRTRLAFQQSPEGRRQAAMKQLRSLLLDAADLQAWFPCSDEHKLAKADVLAGELPVLLDALVNAAMDRVMTDTVVEL